MRRTSSRGALVVVVALCLLAVAAPHLRAQTDTPAESAEPDPLSEDAIAARRKEVADELAARRAALEELGPGNARAPLEAEIASLTRMETLLDEQVRAARDDEPNTEESAEERRIAGSIAELATLHAVRERTQRRTDALRDAVDASNGAMENARAAFETKDRQRREARDAKDTVAPHTRHLRDLEAREAQETLNLRELELRSDRAALALQEERSAELDRLIE
jgi:hypothetical protein